MTIINLLGTKKNLMILVSLLSLMDLSWIYGQCPTTDFSIGSDFCINENITLSNNSEYATTYQWDFCSGELYQTPQDSVIFDVSGTSDIRDLDLVQSNNNWYAFMTDWSGNQLIRLDFGTSLDQVPVQHSVAITGQALSSAFSIRMIKENNNWYGLAFNAASNNITRIDFGPDIEENTVVAYEVVSGIGQADNVLEIANDNGDWVAVVGRENSFQIINFGNLITNIPNPGTDIITTSSSSGASFADLKLQYDCDNWYGFAVSFGNRNLYKLNFGSDLFSEPSVVNIGNSVFARNPMSIDLTRHLGEYVGFVKGYNSTDIYRITLGDDLSSPLLSVDNLSGIFSSITRGLTLANDDGNWKILQVNTGGTVYKTYFDFECGTSILSSTEKNPRPLFYSQSGIHNISLRSFNEHGNYSEYFQQVTITANTAPPISFTDNANECLGQANNFTPSDMGLVSYEWSFDGGVTSGFSSTADTTHTFSQVGDSIVFLTVSDGTCSNFAKDTISIYPVPATPTFSTPGAPFCTGANLVFENLFDESEYNGATLTYDWNYNGEGNSAERDGSYTFDSEGDKTITLTASIPGCSTPSAGTDITLIAGPDVNFSFEDLCAGNETQFTNSTTGTGITGQTWSFGDGSGTSSASSPTYSYAAHGNYDVSLTVNNNQGCSNELTLPITIDDKPVASFNYGPACEGVDIAFENGSTVGGAANITSYEWDFEGLGTSTDQNPNFTFDSQGSYDVELIVETTAGCRDTITSTVNVLLAPAANFEVDLGCINTETIFLDQSEGDFSNPITQWIWTIDGNLASYSSSFGEVYNDAGDHTISLLVRSANSCQSVHNDNFTISELPVVDFTVEKACDNESTVFQDATNSSSAGIETYSWEFGNQGSSTSNPATHQFTSAGSYTVGLNIVDETGCEGSIQKTITIHPSPTAIINASADIGPAPLMIDFTDESQSTQSSFWLFGDEDESTSSENNPQFTYNDEGDYTAQLISTNDLGCSDTTSLAVTVADPILDLELVQISTEESEEKTSVSLTVRNSGNVILHGFDIRIDLDNNSSIFESYSGTITRGKSITYPLNFTFSSVGNNIGYTCITLLDRVEEFEDINIVNNESCIDFNQQLIIENSYPNPVRNTDTKIRFNMILPADGPVQIFLLNATGAVLYQETYMEAKAGLNSFFLDIYSFEQGMYFIKTVYDQNESTQRFVKM